MLSGGEKALSAMALIFSLFLLNPSPFCVMDEVDAPLDEFSLAAFTGAGRRIEEPLAVHHDHAQSAHDAARRPYPRRDDGSSGHLADHLAQAFRKPPDHANCGSCADRILRRERRLYMLSPCAEGHACGLDCEPESGPSAAMSAGQPCAIVGGHSRLQLAQIVSFKA